jgi:hypothetical protein
MAANLDYQVSLGAGRSDNVQRTPENEVDENIVSTGLRFALDEQSRRLRADVVADLAYNKYLDDTYDSELVGNVYAETAFILVPERVLWSLSDQFGQVLTDPFEPATADNRENINYFSTGPDLVFGMGEAMRLRVGARYALVDYETSPLDSSNINGELSLIRSMSDRRSISLNASVQQVEYDETLLDSDFDQSQGYIRYEAEGGRTNLRVDAGYAQLDREADTETEGGMLLRFDASRRVSASSTIVLTGGRSFSTSAGAFANDQGISDIGVDTAPGRQTSDPFALDQLALSWRFNRNRTGLDVSVNWSERSYEDIPAFDQAITTLSARYRRALSPMTELTFFASHSAAGFEQPDTDYDDMEAGVSFSWRLSRNFTFDVQYDYNTRNSDSPLTEYSENRLWLTLSFGRGEPRTGRLPPTFGIDVAAPAGN